MPRHPDFDPDEWEMPLFMPLVSEEEFAKNQGKWIAVFDGEIVGSHKDHDTARQNGMDLIGGKPTMVFIRKEK